MRILLVSVKNKDCKGGIATWTYHYLKWMKEHNIECDVINTDVIGKRRENMTSGLGIIEESLRLRNIIKQTNNFVQSKIKYDIIHFNTNIGNYGIFRDNYLVKILQKKRIPIICQFHCDIPFWINNNVKKYFTHLFLKKSSKILVLCENSKKYLEKEFCIESIKIPNFIRDDIVINQKTINKKIKNIFFDGRISYEKGCKEIFEVARLFPDIQFYLAGEVSEEFRMMDKPSNINLIGLVKHETLCTYLDKSDIFLFPSHTEGFSLSLLESMSRGVPSIATNVGANADMLENKGGIIVSIGDIESMKNAIYVLEDENKRSVMSKWLINKVKNEYTVNAVMKKIINIYESIKN